MGIASHFVTAGMLVLLFCEIGREVQEKLVCSFSLEIWCGVTCTVHVKGCL